MTGDGGRDTFSCQVWSVKLRAVKQGLQFFLIAWARFLKQGPVFQNTTHNQHNNSDPLQNETLVTCKNYTLIYQNHILLPYEAHTFHMTYFSLSQ